jgi:zinc D-Ala-D-Ala carboxypeptidase
LSNFGHKPGNNPGNKRGNPLKSSQLSASSFDDIPEAVRETVAPGRPTKPAGRAPMLVGIGIAVLIGGGGWLLTQLSRSGLSPGSPQAGNGSPNASAADTVLGHYKYAEAPAEDLEAISGDGGISLRKAAAEAFKTMVAAAQAEGVSLAPISGFRSIADQQELFFKVKEARVQTAAERANVSAPPGYSEHHTGYAVDIGDANGANLTPEFENTAAFHWMQANAPRYSFELSFPKNNPQGVTYEPWHWRYVGNSSSLETFYKARGK